MRALWLLHEIGATFELIEMPFDLSVLRAAGYLAVHPLGRVPCLVDDDFKLFESGAITEYLCERFPQSGLGRAQGDPERYEWLQWIHYSETIAVHAAALVQQYHFLAAPERSAAVLRLEGRRLRKAIEVLNARLQDRACLLRRGFSAADVSVGYSVHLAHRFIAIEEFPAVASYYAKLQARRAFRAALPKDWERPLTWLQPFVPPASAGG